MAGGFKIDLTKYCDILAEYLHPDMTCKPVIKDRYVFQEDNAPSHSSKISKAFKAVLFAGHEVLCWPACSPDLSPLGYWLWGKYNALMAGKDVSTQSKVRTAVWEASQWFQTPAGMVATQKAIDHFPVRLRACLAANGGHFEGSL